MPLRLALFACVTLLMPAHAAAQTADGDWPPATAPVTPAPPPEPRPALKTPKRGAFPMKPWSYAKAFTYNFFAAGPVQMRVLSDKGTWSPHIRSEQVIAESAAVRAAGLVAETKGTIETTKCTFPRHAIVYFDREDIPVATVDVCFDCEAVLAWPDYPKPGSYDWERAERQLARTLPKWRRLLEDELDMDIDYKASHLP